MADTKLLPGLAGGCGDVWKKLRNLGDIVDSQRGECTGLVGFDRDEMCTNW